LRRLTAWLDYAVDLGASGLAMGPIFAAETHGYDTVDHFRIDSRLGDDADFDALVAAAHDRGLRVLLDGVFNHVGRGHPAFRSPATANWFVPEGDDFATFEGHGGLVALNHREPAVADLVADVMNHWLSRGADGWRLDAAYAVPTEFWATRAVEGNLECAERAQLLRAGPRARPAQHLPGNVCAADLPRQPRRDPAGQPTDRPAGRRAGPGRADDRGRDPVGVRR
jgi:glycosidase